MIREARPQDAEAIARLLTQLGYPTTALQAAARLAGVLARPDWMTLVWDDGKGAGPAGFVGMQIVPTYTDDAPVARISALVVEESRRSEGIGEALLGALEARAVLLGARRAVVTTATHRERAQRFYERLGFTRTGFRFGKELAAKAGFR
jgi:ribosomal protein S18 acetylase RimI-like enzyme